MTEQTASQDAVALAELAPEIEAQFAQIPATDAERTSALEHLADWYSHQVPYRAQLQALLDAGQWSMLFDSFYRILPFGTGGRRGPVGVGTNRFNAVTLSSSVQGHVDYLRALHPSEELKVVVGFDVRQFNDLRELYAPDQPNPLLGMRSEDFARVAAEVYTGNGVTVYMPEGRYVTTPEMSFSIRELKTHGGLYVSASHNHPDDNGGKFFNDQGGQEVPPRDNEMAVRVEQVSEVRRRTFQEAKQAGLVQVLPVNLHDRYIALNRDQGFHPERRDARIAFTPLHGTGVTSVHEALIAAGFDSHLVPAQAEPDGRFPTVPFRAPNPEVPESMTIGLEFAQEIGADLLMSCDPDADRIGVCARDQDSTYRFLNGNEIGALVAQYKLSELPRNGATRKRPPLLITTEVTTSLLNAIGAHFGAQVVGDLLVGFKYHGDVLNHIERDGRYQDIVASLDDLAVAAEESHGVLVSPAVRDKDAAGAAVVLAELAATEKRSGRSVVDYLDDIYKIHGYHANVLSSLVMADAVGTANIRKIQASLRADPPAEIGGCQVLQVTDHLDQGGRFGPFKGATDEASRDLLVFNLDGNARVIIRPSGTEPKNKTYIEVRAKPLGLDCPHTEFIAMRERIDQQAAHLAESFTLLMLARLDIELPVHALRVSGLVSLDSRIDFARQFLPELESRVGTLAPGENLEPVRDWVDQRLSGYGKDPRGLVKGGIRSYVAAERSLTESARRLQALNTIQRLFD